MTRMDKKTLNDIRDRKAAATPGRRRARKHAHAADGKPVAGAFAHGSGRLFLVRESAEYAWMLMAKMIEQTLWPYRHDANVAAALSHGITPLLKTAAGLQLRSKLGLRVLRTRDGTSKELGVLFRIGGDWFLYALTSAGKTGYQGDNEFTTVLIDILRETRPRELISGPFNRLARRMDLAAQLLPVLKQGRTTAYTYEIPTGMDLGSPGGEAQWDALAKAAEWDYRSTLTRLLTGVVYELKNNRFPRAAIALPYGYKKDKEVHKHDVVPDPSQGTIVRRLIELAASDETELDIATELAKLGLTSRQPGQVRDGRNLAVDKVADPAKLVSGLFSHLPVYLDGIYRFQYEMTLPHLDDFHGFTVHRHAPEDYGYITADLDFGLPSGGWHDREVVEAAIRKRLIEPGESPRPPRNLDTVKPLAGVGHWLDDDEAGFEYVLFASDERVYTLRRRLRKEAFDSETGKRLSFGPDDYELVGRFRAAQLHAAYARALGSIEDAVLTDLPCPAREVTTKRLDDLRGRIEAAEQAAANAREEVVRATDEHSKNQYRQLAEDHQAAAIQLRSELTDLERPSPAETLQLLDGDQVAALIAVLQSTDERADAEVNRLVRRLTQRLTIDATPCEPLAELTMYASVRTTHGAVTMGPISVPVTNTAVGVPPGKRGYRAAYDRRNHRLVELVLLEEGSPGEIAELWRGERFDARAYRRRMIEALRNVVPTSGALSALIDCPILDLRRAVLGPMLGKDLEHDLPEPIASEALRLYRDPNLSWSNGWCPGGMTRRRSLLRFLDLYATDPDDGLESSVIREALGLDYATLYGYLHNQAAKPSYHRHSTPTYRVVEDADGWLSRPRSRTVPHPVRVLACPHCGERKLLQPLKVPEVPGHLLCTSCHREPRTGHEYPEVYFLPWDGPQTLPRRRGDGPIGGGRHEPSRSGLIIVGSDTYDPPVPSLHTPRRGRTAS